MADPSRRPATFSSNSWSKIPAGYGFGFTSAPLDEDLTAIGPVAADLWVTSTASDTDLQVTISEVRSDGTEMFVTTGVQRASQRPLDSPTDTPPHARFVTLTGRPFWVSRSAANTSPQASWLR
ncbi:MAG: CocE/NonD family hydrolase C-terminal non-catalytic domain-containing protein [Actinomycetota bacterium]